MNASMMWNDVMSTNFFLSTSITTTKNKLRILKDRFFFSYSTWLLRRLTAGTAINDAILAGQRSADCEKKFNECNLESKKLQQMFDLLLRSIN